MADARQSVKDLTNEANVIVLKIADLQNKFYSMDDGFNRETIQREIQKSFYEQDLNRKTWRRPRQRSRTLKTRRGRAARSRAGLLHSPFSGGFVAGWRR